MVQAIRHLQAGLTTRPRTHAFVRCCRASAAAAAVTEALPCLMIDAQDSRTPLHVAVALGLPPFVKELLLHGAAVDIPDSNGNVPLHVAAEQVWSGADMLTCRSLRTLDLGIFLACVHAPWRTGRCAPHASYGNARPNPSRRQKL